ncbi:MAG: aspartate/tyrosine/aromatic aminotransferase [Arenicella sp.]|nr:aspartate/tyrosine/aromatic aminotransferase [Arenicella sp.]
MFENINSLPADPILGLNSVFNQDRHPDKINLTVGVYQDSNGATPIFSAVKKAERSLLSEQESKAYLHQSGSAKFVKHIPSLLLGDDLVQQLDARLETVMTPGGSGALHLGAKLVSMSSRSARIWVSDPTWGNHYPLLQSSGLHVETYSYYDAELKGVNFARMMESLSQIPEGDAVLLHGCCHNPTGADLTKPQCDELIELMSKRNLLPFIDIAYQGFGKGLEEDAYLTRLAARTLPEVIIASSCSKSFGVYRERVGAISIITENEKQTAAAQTHVFSAARCSYSMPPYHGGGTIGRLLDDENLKLEWQTELEKIRCEMIETRSELSKGLNAAQNKVDFSFLNNSSGMFCYLGISREQVLKLRSEYGIYLLENGRINVAGISKKNLPVMIDRMSRVIGLT